MTLVKTKYVGDGITKTDGFTIAANTPLLAVAIAWVYKFITTGVSTPVSGLVPA